jgi:hypothetical protein
MNELKTRGVADILIGPKVPSLDSHVMILLFPSLWPQAPNF